jgi:hypothetical protein
MSGFVSSPLPPDTSAARTLTGMSADEAAGRVMNDDISDLLDQAEVVPQRLPAKMVTAVRIDLDTQSALESAATARGIDTTTLMRQIIEEWVQANSDAPKDQLRELVRRLDAAHQAASLLANRDPA